MGRWLFPAVALAGLLALAACAAQEQEKEKAPPPPAPVAPAPEAKPAWQEEWERLLTAAKKEGTIAVVFASSAGAEARRALTEPFERGYGIKVEFAGVPEFRPRIRAEREAGQYLWDVYVGATSTAILTLKEELKALEPLEPALLRPEVKDPKSWKEDRLDFVDKDRLLVATTGYATVALFVNPNLADPKQFTSWKDLLDPRWKGKILLHDPRVTGAGLARFHFFYVHKDLGPNFIRALLGQEPVIARDQEQLLSWLAAGRAPILVGGSEATAEPRIKAGLPLRPLDATQLREGGSSHVGVGAIALFNRAPHPNAAKLYLNWFLSREGQTEFSRATGLASRRLDVPTDHLKPGTALVPGASYISLDTEESVYQRSNVVLPFLHEVLR